MWQSPHLTQHFLLPALFPTISGLSTYTGHQTAETEKWFNGKGQTARTVHKNVLIPLRVEVMTDPDCGVGLRQTLHTKSAVAGGEIDEPSSSTDQVKSMAPYIS